MIFSTGVVVGVLITYVYFRFFKKENTVSKNDIDAKSGGGAVTPERGL